MLTRPARGSPNGTAVASAQVHNASARLGARRAPGLDDDHERRVRLLLLGKGAVLAHGFDRPLAVESDDERESRVRRLLLGKVLSWRTGSCAGRVSQLL